MQFSMSSIENLSVIHDWTYPLQMNKYLHRYVPNDRY